MSGVLRCVVVDDEEPARRLLRSMLRVWPVIDVVGEAADGEAALELIRREHPDLIFLDVQIPTLNGFDIIEAMSGAPPPLVIFVTAYDQYALRAFEVNACDYLLKPFDEERLGQAVQRAVERLGKARAAEPPLWWNALLDLRGVDGGQIVVKVDGRHLFVEQRQIDWIEANGKESRLHVGKNVITTRETLGSLQQRLNPTRFLRIHRSTIVNRTRIREMQRWFRGEYIVILADGTRVHTGRHYQDAVRQLLGGESTQA